MTGLRADVRLRWIGSAVVLLALSYGVARWASTRPSYDAFGWLVWGYQTLHGTLDLNGAPSWKPLSWLFTTPFALFGSTGQLWLWLTSAVALSLAGVAFAARVAHRLARLADLPGHAALLAGTVAGLALLGIQDYSHYVLSAQSDPVIVACCLGAIDCALRGRPRWAMTLGVLACLGRPESWPFVALYAAWLWRTAPALRPFVALELIVVPALWFGVPEITNGKPFVAQQLALNSPRAPHGDPVGSVITRFVSLHVLSIHLLALGAVAWATLRRERGWLALAGTTVGWVVIEIAFAIHGWAGLPRYMFEAGGLEAVLAGLAVGLLVAGLPHLPRLPARAAARGGPVLAGLVLVALVPSGVARVRVEHRDLRVERGRTHEIDHLQAIIPQLGGYRFIRRCGRPVTSVRFVSVLAWLTRLNVGSVGHHPNRERRLHHASVFFLPLPDGWSVLPWHLHRRERSRCGELKSAFVYPPSAPAGQRTQYIRASFR